MYMYMNLYMHIYVYIYKVKVIASTSHIFMVWVQNSRDSTKWISLFATPTPLKEFFFIYMYI